MKIVFIVIASVVAAFVLLIVGIIVLLMILKWRLKRAVAELGDSLKELGQSLQGMAAGLPPNRVHLKPEPQPAWEEKEKVLTAVGDFHALGFQDVGTFGADELPKLRMWALVHPGQNLYGVVYEQPPIGVWSDLVTAYEDGGTFTVVNNAQGEGMDRPPGHPILRLGGARIDEMYRRMVAERPAVPVRPLTAEQFIGIFEKAYADYMDWRRNRGFASEEEIRSRAERDGQVVDENVVAWTRGLLDLQVQQRLHEDLRAACRREMGATSDDEWERLSPRLVFVHEGMTIGEAQAALAEATDGEMTKLPDVSADDARAYFREVNGRLPENVRFRHVTNVTEPVTADVYERAARTEDVNPEREGEVVE